MMHSIFIVSFGKSYGIFERALPYALSLAREDYVCWSPYTLQKAASGLVNMAFIDIDAHKTNFLYISFSWLLQRPTMPSSFLVKPINNVKTLR